MYKKALHSHAQARQQEETPWQENRQAGRQAAHAGTYTTVLLGSANKESTYCTACRRTVPHWRRERTIAQNPNRATHRVSCVTLSTSKHGFYSLELQNYVKLCR